MATRAQRGSKKISNNFLVLSTKLHDLQVMRAILMVLKFRICGVPCRWCVLEGITRWGTLVNCSYSFSSPVCSSGSSSGASSDPAWAKLVTAVYEFDHWLDTKQDMLVYAVLVPRTINGMLCCARKKSLADYYINSGTQNRPRRWKCQSRLSRWFRFPTFSIVSAANCQNCWGDEMDAIGSHEPLCNPGRTLANRSFLRNLIKSAWSNYRGCSKFRLDALQRPCGSRNGVGCIRLRV